MEYMLTFNQTQQTLETHEQQPATLAPWMAYMQQMQQAGVMRGGNRLAPPWTASTVRVRDGQRQVQDGPFADTKEFVAGYVIIDVPSLDEAITWAARSPSSAVGSTEVRPVHLQQGR